MSAYNQEFNKDNTILRYIIVALLAELRDKVYYYNQIDEDTLKKIPIPFFYSITGDGRFLMDNFLWGAEEAGKAIGDYESVPRGIIQLTGISIDSGNQTNKFARGEFVQEWEGVLKTFSMETNFLPINMSFDCTVVCSSNLEMLKVTESLMSKIYKNTLFQIDLGMMRVAGTFAVPEDYAQNRLFEFQLNDKKEWSVTFPIEVSSFMPVFESGILIPEVSLMTKSAIKANPTAQGVGMLRSGANNELGIYFGGIFQKFEYTEDSLLKVQPGGTFSNQGYINPDAVQTGPRYNESQITSAPIVPESLESLNYRNAKAKPEVDESGLGSVDSGFDG
jgi:hypothetical protein|tara:strand:- start:52 stop:1053 length:1002 start_codon:yes stop_codon:yes gene_type:complete